MSPSIEVVDLTGDSFARGRSFGFSRRAQIQSWLCDWLGTFNAAGIPDSRAYVTRLLRDTAFLTAVRRHTPDLLEEVRGIADGAGQPFELLFAQQLMDEEWAYRAGVVRHAELLEKCSSAAIHPRKGLTWIGQNMDLGRYTDGHQVVMRIAPHTPEQGTLIFTIDGMIALMGVNARAVGVCVNSLSQLPAVREGVPVAFVIRKLLQAESVEHAAQMLSVLPHATGQHYLIADPNSIRSFEASAAGVQEYRSPDPARVVHTNHPLAECQGTPRAPQYQANSQARLRSLANRLLSGEPDLEAIKEALSSCDDPEHPVCRTAHRNGQPSSASGTVGFTTGSMVSTLRSDVPWIDSGVSNGPPRPREYVQVRLFASARSDL